MKIFNCFVFILFLSLHSSAGNFTGNGGDHVRGLFLKMGRTVIEYLKETDDGKRLLEKNNLKIKDLENLLSIESISTVDHLLTDNGGSSVDALGEKGKITLQKSRWTEHFEKQRDIYYLVFHELLRASDINDDNYVISKALQPFPKSRMVNTRINAVFPLIDSERLDQVFDTERILIGGNGCSLNTLGTHVDFDKETNQLSIAFDEYNLSTKISSNTVLDRKVCSVSFPLRLKPKTRLIVTQMDIMAKVDLSVQTALNFGAEVFFTGKENKIFQKTISGLTRRQRGRSLLRENSVLKSECGFSGIFRTNSSAWLKASHLSADSTAEISDFKLSFKIENCN